MTMRITDKDHEWQQSVYEKAKDLAGRRYTPELNVDLPIIQTFDGLARNEEFYARVRKLFGELRKGHRDIFPRNNCELLGLELINFDYCAEELLGLIAQIKEYSTVKIPWEEIAVLKKKLEEHGWKLQDKIHEVQASSDNEKKDQRSEKIFSSESYYLSKFRNSLYQLGQLCHSDAAKLSNYPFLLLTGVTGIGKTHLLCDLVKKRIEDGAFSFITLGQEINDTEDIWKQIRKLNSDSRLRSKNALLKKFNRLGERTRSRFFIIIDALNETKRVTYWKKTLPVLLRDIRRYPNIALVVSVRSGFEKEIVTTKVRKRFHEVEHEGFRFREWEAIKKFFTEFGLPLPEIPLINPEFSVPLFLLLFCESRKRRAKTKKGGQLFRGHEGSTSIFEDFIKGVSKEIAQEFKVGGVDKVWNKLIKPLAEGMVNNRGLKDRISEARFKAIVARELPTVDPGKLSSSLEKHHLLIEIPRYGKGGKRTGFDYRFTYQRFSDHLVARYLMNKYADKKVYGANTRKHFKEKLKKSGAIGRYFDDYSFRGVIGALSIQVPERLDGEEFINLCPHLARQMLEEPFLESIIWRKPKAFYLDQRGQPEKTIKIINTLVLPFEGGHSKFFSTVLNVSGVPEHPFSALQLHSYLMRLGMASRDNLWSTFLHHDYGESGSVDRLLHWVLSASFNKAISDPSKLLIGVVLTWFFTTSNRSIRDKATKGLVILLDNSPSILFELNKLFLNVDDPYVTERLYAVTYGVILRLKDYRDPVIKRLGKLIYQSIFLAKKPVAHILIRDYAKCTLDLLVKKKVYYPPNPAKVKAVLNTLWSRLPTIKTLEDKFEPKNFSWDTASYEDRGIRSIWNSFDGIGDFFRYIVEPAINHWSNTKNGESLPPSVKDLEKKFKKTLNRDQTKFYKQIENFHHFTFVRISRYLKIDKKNITPEEKKKIREENRLERLWKLVKKSFWDSLSIDQKVLYRKILRQTQYRYPRKTGHFDPELAKRFILKRVFELYSPKLHGYFDGMHASHSDREPAEVERIGKKYQWIALYELLGHLADNFIFLEKDYPPEAGVYKGAWQIDVRDIDPSCIVLNKPNYEDSTWQPKYDAWKTKLHNDKWLRKRADLPKPKEFLTYRAQNKEWFILNTFFQWQQDVPPEEERYHYPSRDIFYVLNAYLIRQSEKRSLFRWLKNQNFYGRWMPETRNGIREVFFREFPNSPIYDAVYSPYDDSKSGWISKVGFRKRMPGVIMESGDEYSITSASRDKSVEESFNICLPSKWMVKLMGIKHSTRDGFWVTSGGKEVVCDLSLEEGGRSSLFIEKEFLLKFLNKHHFCLVWTLLGEKAILGGERGKLQGISGAYLLESDGSITGQLRMVAEKSR
jgi:hypothetical protein